MAAPPFTLGAVAYDPKVVTIWEGFKDWFASHDFAFDYVLFSNYEAQVEAHLRDEVDVTWDSPLAWVRTRRLAGAAGRGASAVAMRDTDQDLTSVVLVQHADDDLDDVRQLEGRVIACGARDSPQATLLPLAHLVGTGVDPRSTSTLRRFDVMVGKHGDHIGGERDAVAALVAGEADTACVIDGNQLAFAQDGTLAAGQVRVLTRTAPYDHCTMTVLENVDEATVQRFVDLLLSMSYDDPAVRPLLQLEGLREWRPGRTEGYRQLESAVDVLGFYDADGSIPRGDMTEPWPVVELDDLGFDGGAHILVKLALADLARGDAVAVRGRHPDLVHHLAVWCRREGHRLRHDHAARDVVGVVERGATAGAAWVGATRAGHADPTAVAQRASADWGLTARGAAVEPGGPAPRFTLVDHDPIWTDRAAGLYAQALASQWDPASAIDWTAPLPDDEAVEAAVVQVMTFLVENEEATLVVPARFLGQVHPHFREIQQALAATVADEARHIDVFTRRATLSGRPLALSGAAGRMSLQTLLDEPDFATASFLLSVMGEGTFLALLGFLERHAPDQLTRRIAHLTRNDEARHVAFAMAHLERHVRIEPELRGRLARAVEGRHHALQQTAGLNADVFDSLVVVAAGSPVPARVAAGWLAVQELQHEMADARAGRLTRLGFTAGEADALAALHTRNFM